MTITYEAPWWRTAPNPPCVSWCEFPHPEDDFRQAGGMLCCKVIADEPRFFVEAQSYIGTNEAEDALETQPASLCVVVRDLDNEDLSPTAARELLRALALAVTEAATICERTVRP